MASTEAFAGSVAALLEIDKLIKLDMLDLSFEGHSFDGGALSRPVDAGLLTSRLLDISSKRTTQPQRLTSRKPDISSGRTTSPRSSTPSLDRESLDDTLPPSPQEDDEKRAYYELVEQGGRPFFQIGLIHDIARDPLSHWNIVRPWALWPPLDSDLHPDSDFERAVNWNVFPEQLRHWKMFRDWQEFNRDNQGRWDGTWDELRSTYNRWFSTFRNRCPTYVDAVKELLAEYGFTRPFQFHADPTQQDKLTTWIEYLGYECWLHYRCTSFVKSNQRDRDAAWTKLVDSNTLRSLETEEFVSAPVSAALYRKEEEQAIRIVESAKANGRAVLAKVFKDATLASAVRKQMILAAKTKCEAAEAALAFVTRRNHLVGAFKQLVKDFKCKSSGAMRHSMRVQWALEQVPLIEAESNHSNMVEISRDVVRGTKRRLDNDEDDKITHSRPIKRQRREVDERELAYWDGPSHQQASRDDAAHAGQPVKRLRRCNKHLGSHVETWNDAHIPAIDSHRAFAKIGRPDFYLTTPKPLRRSARLAARQEAMQAGITRQGATKSQPARSLRRDTLHTPLPPICTTSQDQPLRPPVAKTKKQDTKRGRHRNK
ncbi:unnamed protein product [Discula destructiva]